MNLSKRWKIVLSKLAEYSLDGIPERELCALLGDAEYGVQNPAEVALSQMYFSGVGYYEPVPGKRGWIRITSAGHDALESGDPAKALMFKSKRAK